MLNNVFQYLRNAYENDESKIAIVDHEKKITYKELYENSLRVAAWINEKFAIKRQPIIVFMHNSANALASFMGIAESGNIYVPLDPDIPDDRKRMIFSILNPMAVIICDGNVEKIKKIYNGCMEEFQFINSIALDEIKATEYERKIIDTDPLYILFTSGSTGIPKGVIVSHRGVIDFTEEASETMNFSSKEVFLNQAPFYFDASIPDIYCTLRNHACLHIVDKKFYSFPIKIVDYIEKNRINALYWVPSALVMVANFKVLEKRDISSLKKVMFCGEVMPIKQLNMWMKVIREAVFVNYYGPSEAIYASSYYILDRCFDEDEKLPIGKAAFNTDILIINNEGKEAQAAEVGELYIRGTGLALGYYNDIVRTKERFVQNPLHNMFPEIVYKTGDLAHFDEKGYIYFDGRVDFQIKHMGYRIELEEIEALVNSIEGIQQVACIYDNDKKEICMFYVGDCNDIENKLKDIIPIYMIPRKIYKIDRMPINLNGKIDRKRLDDINDNAIK